MVLIMAQISICFFKRPVMLAKVSWNLYPTKTLRAISNALFFVDDFRLVHAFSKIRVHVIRSKRDPK